VRAFLAKKPRYYPYIGTFTFLALLGHYADT